MRGKLSVIIWSWNWCNYFQGSLATCSKDEDGHIALNIYRKEIFTQVHKHCKCSRCWSVEEIQILHGMVKQRIYIHKNEWNACNIRLCFEYIYNIKEICKLNKSIYLWTNCEPISNHVFLGIKIDF